MDMSLIEGLLGIAQQPQQPQLSGLLESRMPNFDLSKYEGLTANNQDLNVDFKPLNFDKLIESGALRVTNQGLPDGSFNPDPKAGFSLVSAYNDIAGGNSKTWANNPEAYGVVRSMFQERPTDIGGYKYMQIVQSAKDLGLKDSDIFLNR